MRRSFRNIGALVLLILFVGYWCSITLFPHVHRINGQVYVHSHPYGDWGGTAHTHTPQEFQFIKHLSLLVMTVATLAVFIQQLSAVRFIFSVPPTSPRQNEVIRHHSLRAPPVMD